jgi:hypothetical protein
MKSSELREQAKRWRERAPQYDEEIGQALLAAADSFEDIAKQQDAGAPEQATPDTARPFIHQAYKR